MNLAVYRRILEIPSVRLALLLGFLVRAPLFAASIILTLHVVSTLKYSYAAAGVLSAVSTLGLAVSAPWRGRLLDMRGLRRTVLPQLGVLAIVWTIAPWVGYGLLLPLVFVGGLFVVPTFSIMRQVLIAAVEDENRTAALSLDSIVTDLTFVVGPVLGVLTATYLDTRLALFVVQMLAIVGGALLCVTNPRLVREDEMPGERAGRETWMSPAIGAVLAASMAIMLVFTATDLGVVAGLRSMGHPGSIGWVLSAWGLGSVVGAIGYGALRHQVSIFVLLILLGASTAPLALAPDRYWLVVLLFVSGIFAAPTVVATSERLTRTVPPGARGEVMGWQGSAFTGGAALGAPIAGLAIDSSGWESAFVLAAVIGIGAGLIGLAESARRDTGRSR